MSLFKFGKSKDSKDKGCCCGGDCNEETMRKAKESKDTGNRVKILGSGCAKCNELERNIVEALRVLNQSAEVDHIKDFTEIASYGVISTPAVVLDGKVISYGKVLKVNEAIKLLEKLM